MANLGTLMIDEQYVKDMSFIDENVDAKLLRLTIFEAQRIHIRAILGTGIYNQILSQIEAGTLSGQATTLTNRALVRDYVAHSLLYWTLFDAVFMLAFKFTNKDIVRKTSEVSQTASVEDLKMLRDNFKDKAQYYDQRMINYLQENSTTFTLYNDPGNGIDIIRPRKGAYNTGMYLGQTRGGATLEQKIENPQTYNNE